MFFQISPVIHKKIRSKAEPEPSEDEESKPEILSLAPFTPNPKISFNNVLIGSAQTRKLQIRNPSNHDVNILIKKSMPDEINLVFSWETATISNGSDVILEMAWCPSCEVACRHVFTVTDGKRINRDVGVVFKSVAAKNINVLRKNKPTKPKAKPPITAPLRRKSISPVKKKKPTYRKNIASPITHCSQSQYYNTPWSNLVSNSWNNFVPQNVPYYYNGANENKENLEAMDLSTRNNATFVNAKDDTFTLSSKNTDNERRETFTLHPNQIPQDRRETFIVKKIQLPETKTTFTKTALDFHDSLEEPTTPFNEIGENRNFVPSFEYKLKVLERFAFSPAMSPHFNPPQCSTTTKPPPSTNDSSTNKPQCNRLFVEEQSYSQINLSGGTYTKENLSGGTYTKLNISEGTFVKESSSIGDINQFDLSPLTTRESQNSSPVFPKPRCFNFFDSTPNIFKKSLSAITEESSMVNQTCGFKRKSPSVYQHSSPKRASFQPTAKKTDWSKRSAIPHTTVKTTSGLNLQKFLPQQYDSVLSSITETKTKKLIINDPFLFASTTDPFMTSNIYCDENWVEEQQNNFKKWLNALLTPPDELNTKTEGVDVAKVWQHCKKNEVKEAPTKEALSMTYHSNSKLDHVRKQALILYRSKEVSDVLQKVFLCVETGKLSIRDDKDIHLNLKLKSDLIALILGYNPLWLRIGLEAIYNEVIPLKSNSDTTGLIHFLMERFFKDPNLMRKNKSNVYAPKYASELRKFILKKFLYLVYFLDKAKMTKLIKHDPCLFCLNAQEKESRLVLIHFARETLSAVGDITKYLRCLGYTVAHVQTYVHEFDYAVKNLGVDLRDGVRLSKVMEIIQIRDDLTSKLRVPAISRLQKVHNLQLVFQSLRDNGYEIQNDISPKDIVDGHKEKTLSFLWQIIHKFEAPLIVKSVTTIQKWFRSLPVMLKRRKLQKLHRLKEDAASTIQLWYRRQKLSEQFEKLGEILKQVVEENRRMKAVVRIQSFWRMITAKRKYALKYNCVIKIQAYSKGWLIRNRYRERLAAIAIQKNYRRYVARKKYLGLRRAAIIIQRRYRSLLNMRNQKREYTGLRSATLFVQQKFRANLQMKILRRTYLQQKSACIKIQSYWRMCRAKKVFSQERRAAIVIQSRYRAINKMQEQRNYYLSLKRVTIFVQRTYRANILMRHQREFYLTFKNAVITTQSYWRMHKTRRDYLKLKHAAIQIQIWYRSIIQMRDCRTQYLNTKKAVLIIEQRYLALKNMTLERTRYQKLKEATVTLQHRYRALVQMKHDKRNYQELKSAVVVIQQRWRAQKSMIKQNRIYQQLKQATLIIQQRFRAKRLGVRVRLEYLEIKRVTVNIQQRFKANKLMEQDRKNYQTLKQSVVIIQRWYRAQNAMIKQHKEYQQLRQATVVIQQRFRANKLGNRIRLEYLQLRQTTIDIQQRFRAKKLMEKKKEHYQTLRQSVLIIQSRYRAQKAMIKQKVEYQQLKQATVVIQQRFRARQLGNKIRLEYLQIKQASVIIQQRFRAKKLMEKERNYYQSLKQSALVIQTRYRAQKAMINEKKEYQQLKRTTVMIQQRFRAKRLGNKVRLEYVQLKQSVRVIEERYSARQQMLRQRKYYESLREACIVVQRRFRANRAMKEVRYRYLALKQATVTIQVHVKAYLAMKRQKSYYVSLKQATLLIQRRFRAKKLGIAQRTEFLRLKKATIRIQSWYRARRLSVKYSKMKLAVIMIQHFYRAHTAMKYEMAKYQRVRHATFIIQRRWRAVLLSRKVQKQFLSFKKSVRIIQAHYRAYLLAKKVREIYLAEYKAISLLQRYARGFLVRKKYGPQLTPEAVEARKTAKIQNAAAVKIQALWRGYSLRNSDLPEIVTLRENGKARVLEASKAASASKTLAQRCDMAIFCMTNCNSTLLQVMKALEDLDFITRHCPASCIKLSMILPDQLYIIISSASRSLPEMDTCNQAVFILINFYKYPKTRKQIWVPESVDAMINVALHWCDKEAPLFSTLCTLLWLFAHEKDWKKHILMLPNISQRFLKIRSLVQRKQSMVSKTRKATGKPSYFEPVVNGKLPTLTANWGLDYDRPNAFDNAVFALDNLLSKLSLL